MNQSLIPNIVNHPFVFIVDSSSSSDLYHGYSIGMALRDMLRAIRIRCYYVLAINTQAFYMAFQQRLPAAVHNIQSRPNINAIPFIHLCMHGSPNGIHLTDTSFIEWFNLRQLLQNHNNVKGFDPFVCMASCNGLNATNMATAFDKAFNFLIGNTGEVLQSDVTVAYASFYNSIIHKRMSIEDAVNAMRIASGDSNFYYAHGELVQNQKLSELQASMVQAQWNPEPSIDDDWDGM